MNVTHAIDPTRPVHSFSGFVQVCTDIYSGHNYHQDADLLKKNNAGLKSGSNWNQDYTAGGGLVVEYKVQPFLVAEYSGTFWDVNEVVPDDTSKWGYGKGIHTEIENKLAPNRWIKTSFKPTAQTIESTNKKQIQAILNHPKLSGFCFCKLNVVEGEVNGIYICDRKVRFDGRHMKPT